MTDSLRTISNALVLWRLCRRTSCRRAKACKGSPRQCIRDCAAMVPLPAREFVVDVLTDKELGFTPEEAVRDHPETARAFFDWCEAAKGERHV